jgi:hypothetical protein
LILENHDGAFFKAIIGQYIQILLRYGSHIHIINDSHPRQIWSGKLIGITAARTNGKKEESRAWYVQGLQHLGQILLYSLFALLTTMPLITPHATSFVLWSHRTN